MLREKIAESLTARIFLITAGVLLAAGAVTFSFIAWASPSTYTAVVNDDLTAQVDALVGKLANTTPADCGELLDDFVLTSGASAMLVGPDGRLVDTGAKLTVQAVYEDDTMIVTTSEQESTVGYYSQDIREGDTVAVTMSEQATITAEVTFAGQSESYTLYVTPRIEVENLAVRALIQIAPWLLMVLLVFSLLCAFIYSRYITRPIVRMSGIAGKWQSWTSTGNVEKSAGTRSVSWAAVWISWPAGWILLLPTWRAPTRPSGERWNGNESWTASGWPSSTPPLTN